MPKKGIVESVGENQKWHHHCGSSKAGDAVYGLGLFGAFVYFWLHSPTVEDKIIGFLKALVWPALVVYKLLEMWQF